MSTLSQAEINDIAEKAAETTVRRLMLTIGININDPLQAQSDFVVVREIGKLARDPEFRKDIEHTRAWRVALESIRTKSVMTAVGVVITGFMAVVAVGIKYFFGGLPVPPHP